MTYRVTTKLVAILLLTLPTFALAIDVNSPSDGGVKKEVTVSEDITTLKQVTVVGQAEDSLTGSSVLADEVLRQLPKKNSSLTESITLLPRVQIGEEQRTSENAGEILPPLISISGGRAYENHYSVDGVSQGSLLDPLSDNPKSITMVPGHPQRTFIHQDLIESVDVYDSNISARYGRFVGGVVEARTRMPATELGGALSYRTTRDSWTSFKVAASEQENFDLSDDHLQQPRFKKHDAGLEFDIPLNDGMGLLGAYKIIHSELELRHFNEWHAQDKTLENYFLKYVWIPQTPYSLELTALHTPSEEDFFVKNSLRSDFTVDRGGYSLNGTFSGEMKFLSFELTASYLESENSRTAPRDNFNWEISESKDWGTALGFDFSSEGAHGDIDSSETSYQLNTDIELVSLTTGKMNHLVKLGAEYIQTKGVYDRKETTAVYRVSKAVLDEDGVLECEATDPSCVTGEQHFKERTLYLAEVEEARINHFAAYMEDQVNIGAFTFRPGVRLSHNDFMNNTDVAHRLAASWDLFQNGRSVLVAGSNRYYGETLLTYKLREAITPKVIEKRDLDKSDPLAHKPLEWKFSKQYTLYNSYSELDTPYSDELTIGIIQQVLGGELEINYVERENENQFAAETVKIVVDGKSHYYKTMNNNGSSKYESIKASWIKQWRNHYLNINYVYSDQEASNKKDSYDDIFDLEDTEEQVWYNGSLINKVDLPRRDYSREHALNIIYMGALPGDFTFTNVTRYQSGYDTLKDTYKKITLDSGEKYNIYDKVEQPGYWTFDWRLDWEKITHKNQSIVVSLEVNNVFNRTPPSGASDDTYELGRQFWLGMTYKF